ncbi:MAG: GTP-binding protein, partial [Acidimicrobiia bacterium]|nr:GTP-binding protein [Acidimicrobiia bacterium]
MIFRRRQVDLPEQLEALGEAVVLADGRLPADHLEAAAELISRANERLRHGTTHTLVALLGATGSGKSSVANALVGSEVATTGVRRPTTSSTLGCFWGDDDAQPLLDWLDVPNRHHVTSGASSSEADRGLATSLDGLVLLDVPDHDSVAVSHRMEMERIAAHADLLLWVTDAEKYADKAMHDYLRQLSEYGAVTAMVLNKIDLLSDDEIKVCATDLERLLIEEGLEGAPVIPISTVTGRGVDDLRQRVAEAVSKQAVMVERLRADCRTAAGVLLDDMGPDRGTGSVPDKVAHRLAHELVGASGIHIVTDAVTAGHLRDASAKVGWPFTRWARALRPHPLRKLHLGRGSAGRSSLPQISGIQLARSENAVRQALGRVTVDLPEPWDELVARAGSPNQAMLNNQLDAVVSEAVRATHRDRPPVWWMLANGIQMVLSLAVVVGAGWLG